MPSCAIITCRLRSGNVSLEKGGYFISSTAANSNPATPEAYQEDVKNLLDVVNKGLEDYLIPIISNFDQDDQDYVKAMALNGLAGYVNYVIYLAYEEKDIQKSKSENDPDDDIGIDYDVKMGVDKSVPLPYLKPNFEDNLPQ